MHAGDNGGEGLLVGETRHRTSVAEEEVAGGSGAGGEGYSVHGGGPEEGRYKGVTRGRIKAS